MLLIRLERRAHTKDEPERKKRGERERDLRRRTTQKRIEQIVQMKQVDKKKKKKLCRSREFAMAAECNKQTALVAFLLLPFPSLSLSLFTVFYLFFNASSANQ